MQGDVQGSADAADLLVGGDDGLAAADGRADGLAGLGVQHSRGMLQLAVSAHDAALAVGLHVLSAQQLGALAGQQIAQILTVLGQLAQILLPLAGIGVLDNSSHGDGLNGLLAAVLDGHISAALIEHLFQVGYDLADFGLFHGKTLL